MSETFAQIGDWIQNGYLEIGRLNPFWQFILYGTVFISLALVFPGRKQQLFRKGMVADSLYWLLGGALIYGPASQLIGRGLMYVLLVTGIYSVEKLHQLRYGLPPVAELPILLQAFLILLAKDIIQYWTHRMFHTAEFWKFHAIHHSAVDVDWLTSARFHPINVLIHSTFVGMLVYMLGFDPDAWMVLAPFDMAYSPLVHANLNWTYGPFRYLLASPVFHRWHHTYVEEGGNKNFAPTFPFLDVIFGTYYDPKDKRPTVFGIEGNPVSNENILQQLMYPFRKERK